MVAWAKQEQVVSGVFSILLTSSLRAALQAESSPGRQTTVPKAGRRVSGQAERGTLPLSRNDGATKHMVLSASHKTVSWMETHLTAESWT